MKNVRHYPPMTPGEVEDFLDDLHKNGGEVLDHHPARVTWNGAKFVIAADEDTTRIQLLTAPDEPAAWSWIERVHEPWMSVHGDDVIGAEDTKTYGPYTQAQADAMLAKVKSQGMTVTGNNPWHVDTNTHGVKFDATYDGSSITIKITGANFYVSNAKVWDKLDPMMQAAKNISGAGEASSAASSATKPNAVAKSSPKKSADEKEGAGIGMGMILIGALLAFVLLSKK